MAEQMLSQTYPFMSKETFDQVAAVMWGPNDYDYHTSYILSRTEWYDDDIIEEALYATGLARGLGFAALQETSQPISYQNGYRDQSSALSDEGGCQLGCTSQCDPRVGEHYCYTPHVTQSMAQTPLSPPPRPVLAFSELARAPSGSAALQRQTSMANDRSAPRQDSRDYPYGNFGTDTETEVPGMKPTLGFKAVYRPGESIGPVSRAPTSPDGNRSSFVQSSERESSKPEGPETDNDDWVDLGTN